MRIRSLAGNLMLVIGFSACLLGIVPGVASADSAAGGEIVFVATKDFEINDVGEVPYIELKKGAVLAIASNTHTNKLIPEKDGTAWARGRWRQLKLKPE